MAKSYNSQCKYSSNGIKRTKAAHSARNVGQIDSTMEKINQAWQAASQEMYQAQQQGPQGGAGFDPNNMGGAGFQGGNPGANQGGKSGNDTVEDANYEEMH